MITFKKNNLHHTYYFFDVIENIELNLLSINKKCIKNTHAFVYGIRYITIKIINCQNINREVPLCLSFSDVNAYINEENEKNT